MVEFDEKIINAENQKIKEAYTELGELYYKLYKNNYDKEAEASVSKIKAAEKAIESHKAAVLKENGLMLCRYCGSQIQDISRFCNFCGKPVGEPAESEEEPEAVPEIVPAADYGEEPEAVPEAVPAADCGEEKEEAVAEAVLEERPDVCPECGEPVEADFDFCTNCGCRINGSYEKIPLPGENERVCRVCGNPLTDDMIFCDECGTRVGGEVEDKAVQTPAVKKVCPNCGFSTLDNEVNFCVECGARLR